jgi:hypothetical protein
MIPRTMPMAGSLLGGTCLNGRDTFASAEVQEHTDGEVDMESLHGRF